MPQLSAPPGRAFLHCLHPAQCTRAGDGMFSAARRTLSQRYSSGEPKARVLALLILPVNWWPSCCHKKIAQRVHRACCASDTPGNPQPALVFLYLIPFSCPTRSVSPVCKQLTFMPVMHCYRCRVIAYEEINHIICKPRPFLPFPKLCWLFRKKKRKKHALYQVLDYLLWLFKCWLQSPTVVSSALGKEHFYFLCSHAVAFCRYLNDKWGALIPLV